MKERLSGQDINLFTRREYLMEKKFEFISAEKAPVSEEEIIADLKLVAKNLNEKNITSRQYAEYGKYASTTVSRKFGSWNQALEIAGLKLSNECNISDERLYNNLLNLWEHLGRQPSRRDLTNKLSEFSQSPYNRRFTTWTNALQSFVIWANSEELTAPASTEYLVKKMSTSRDPSLRLRFQVMRRDNFTCQQCGASPAKDPSTELHLDHIFPWSKGGETTFENLQTLCSNCNLGKSNL
ncbi:MAG: HNH endonuclease [Sulfuricurvum sp.]|nr:HNH endonuclease [Sulfuricurvum sp.]